MRVGLFSTLIDKIQFAYGWDDERVLDLTLRRAIQIRESIEQREEFARWESAKIIEWQTKAIVGMVANTVESQKAREYLVDVASKLSLTKDPDDTKKNKKKRPTSYRTVDGKEVSLEELKNYSYHEIDHSETDQKILNEARTKNAGIDLAGFRFK